MKRKKYEEHLEPLQIALNNLTRWLQHTGTRMVVLFEGRDTAGKGGVVNAIASTLNTRQVRTVALAKPSDRERSQCDMPSRTLPRETSTSPWSWIPIATRSRLPKR